MISITKEWLDDHYLRQGLTQQQCGDIAGLVDVSNG